MFLKKLNRSAAQGTAANSPGFASHREQVEGRQLFVRVGVVQENAFLEVVEAVDGADGLFFIQVDDVLVFLRLFEVVWVGQLGFAACVAQHVRESQNAYTVISKAVVKDNTRTAIFLEILFG